MGGPHTFHNDGCATCIPNNGLATCMFVPTLGQLTVGTPNTESPILLPMRELSFLTNYWSSKASE